MANQTIQAGDSRKAPYAGDVGNSGRWAGDYTAPAASTASTGDKAYVELFELPAGAIVDHFRAAWSALGASRVMALGFRYKDGSSTDGVNAASETFFDSARAVASAGNADFTLFPFKNLLKPIVVYATISGGTGAQIPSAGRIYVTALGEFVGTN